MSVLVTGASGYVGNNVVRRLVEMGRPVRALVRDMEKTRIRLGDLASKVEIVQGDVMDRASLDKAMKGATSVIHLVAIALERGGATYEEVNYQGTINVVNAAEAAGIKRFINMSQCGASASSPYRFLRSKGKAQEYVTTSSLKWTAVRPSAIFGPQDEFFNSLSRLIPLTPIVFPLIGGGKAQFQPVSVYDVVEAIVRSLDDDSTIGHEYELGGPEVLTLGEIERRVLSAMGTSRILIPAPVGLLRPAVAIMQTVLPGSPVSTNLLDLLSVPNVVKENGLVTKFGITPRPFSGDNISYLAKNKVGDTIRKFLTNATVN